MLDAASVLFTNEFEASIRQLCVDLGYVLEADKHRLGGPPCDVAHDPAELHLFKASSVSPQQTRFRQLFDDGTAAGAQLRKKFFDNSLHNASPAGRTRILHVLDSLERETTQSPCGLAVSNVRKALLKWYHLLQTDCAFHPQTDMEEMNKNNN